MTDEVTEEMAVAIAGAIKDLPQPLAGIGLVLVETVRQRDGVRVELARMKQVKDGLNADLLRHYDDAEKLRAERDALALLLAAVVDEERCEWDQNGYCMAHHGDHQLDGCRVAAARAALAKLEVNNG